MDTVLYIMWLFFWIPLVSVFGFAFIAGMVDEIKKKSYKSILFYIKDIWFYIIGLMIIVFLGITGVFYTELLPKAFGITILWVLSFAFIGLFIQNIYDGIKEKDYIPLFLIIPILWISAFILHITIGPTYFSDTIHDTTSTLFQLFFIVSIPIAIVYLIWKGIKYIIKAMIKLVKQLSNEVDEELKQNKDE
jgi:hypothetical protein